MPKSHNVRVAQEGSIPLLDVEGTAYQCGVWLGHAWRSTLRLDARHRSQVTPCWLVQPYQQIIEERLPHLPDLYRGMAKGAAIPEDQVGTRPPPDVAGGCTSFALQPAATLDGRPISGQTKDTSEGRIHRYVVLRLRLTGGPSALTLTYPGWLYGHGFVQGGCAIFRNSLYAGEAEGILPYDLWGLLALHCGTLEEVVEMTRRYGVRTGGHCTIGDEHGAVIGLELGKGGIGLCRPKRGIYTHANAVVTGRRLARYEEARSVTRENSLFREGRLRERLEADRGRLTAQLAFMALADHEGFPTSICRHQSREQMTSGAVVVEPTRGLLHACRGNPCQNWPQTYRL